MTCLFVCLFIGMHTLLAASVSEMDMVDLNDHSRIYGQIISDVSVKIHIKDEHGAIHKIPRPLIRKLRYADGSNWQLLHMHLTKNSWGFIIDQLQKDMRQHKHGGSKKQVQLLIEAFNNADMQDKIPELCHDLCKHERKGLLSIMDAFIYPHQHADFDKAWLKVIKHSNRKTSRQRCAAVLGALYQVHFSAEKAQHIIEKQKSTEDVRIQEFIKLAQNQQHISQHCPQLQCCLRIIKHKAEQAYDQAALSALRIGLDQKQHRKLRIHFLHAAHANLHQRQRKDAEQILFLIKQIEQSL